MSRSCGKAEAERSEINEIRTGARRGTENETAMAFSECSECDLRELIICFPLSPTSEPRVPSAISELVTLASENSHKQ